MSIPLAGDELYVAHTYVFLNCPKISPYIALFANYAKQMCPHMSSKDLSKYRDSVSSRRLYQHISVIDFFNLKNNLLLVRYILHVIFFSFIVQSDNEQLIDSRV